MKPISEPGNKQRRRSSNGDPYDSIADCFYGHVLDQSGFDSRVKIIKKP